VYEGLVEDAFTEKLDGLLAGFGVRVTETTILPDDRGRISAAVQDFCRACDIVLVTGGTSVDPDDVTVGAIRDAGVNCAVKGVPIQPGNNLTIGYGDDAVVCAVPAAALYYRATSLNVFLPRLLAGHRISREQLHRAGHGGLCHFCETCHFPCCPFGVTH
jgi:molybdopterin biosynthesis enzyme